MRDYVSNASFACHLWLACAAELEESLRTASKIYPFALAQRHDSNRLRFLHIVATFQTHFIAVGLLSPQPKQARRFGLTIG